VKEDGKYAKKWIKTTKQNENKMRRVMVESDGSNSTIKCKKTHYYYYPNKNKLIEYVPHNA